MSREIKFRAWDTLMDASGDELCGPVMRQWDHVKRYMMDRLENDETLQFMQFTGLQDRNGVDIYEGDILRLEDFRMRVGGQLEDVIAPIEWHIQLARFRCVDVQQFGNQDIDPNDWSDGEVIGNIHENPELIEGDSNE